MRLNVFVRVQVVIESDTVDRQLRRREYFLKDCKQLFWRCPILAFFFKCVCVKGDSFKSLFYGYILFPLNRYYLKLLFGRV